MAVISVRFNEEEEKILKILERELKEDRSTLIKQSLLETYRDLVDRREIESFEKQEAKGKTRFFKADEIG